MTVHNWGTSVMSFDPALAHVAGASASLSSPYTLEYLSNKAASGDPTNSIVFEIGASLTELWFGFWYEQGAEDSPLIVDFRNSSNAIALRVTGADSGAVTEFYVQTYDGSTFTTRDTFFSQIGDSGTARFDIHVKLDNSVGIFSLYSDKILRAQFTGDTITNTPTDISNIRVTGLGAPRLPFYISAWIIADTPTIDYVVHQPVANGAGVNTDWTGDYTAIDDGGLGTGDFITSVDFDDKETFTFNTLNSVFSSGYDVESVKLEIGARRASSGVASFISALARIGSTDYISASQALTSSFYPYIFEWTESPATSSPWTWVEIHGQYFGVNLRDSVAGEPLLPAVPSAFDSSAWRPLTSHLDGYITLEINFLPGDGGSAITDLEYQIDGGSWVSLGGTTTGDYGVSGLTDGVEVDVSIRAVNAVGAGTASATKAVTPTTTVQVTDDGDTHQTGNSTVHTYTSRVSTGPKTILCVTRWNQSGSISSITWGGNPMSKLVDTVSGGGPAGAAIYIIDGAQSGNIVITFSGNVAYSAITTLSLRDLGSLAAVDTDSSKATAVSSRTLSALTAPSSGGIRIAVFAHLAESISSAWTWPGCVVASDRNVGQYRMSVAYLVDDAGGDIVAARTDSGADDMVLVGVSLA